MTTRAKAAICSIATNRSDRGPEATKRPVKDRLLRRARSRRWSVRDTLRRRNPQNRSMNEAAPPGQFEGEYQAGTVKWFNRELGWGFIVADAGGQELFADKLFTLPKRKLLHTGQRVRFRIHSFKTGPEAVDIRPGAESKA